ncbi:GNAT family N-acetyltransferase [Brachybacterium vulturis]|nr:GNAT family N-acetyltransferase [Brachybacterium vulturis]
MSAPDPASPTEQAFTISTPTLADVPALARIHVRGWELAYSHLLHGEQWFGQEAIDRRITHWTSWLTPGTPAADEGRYRVGRDGVGAVIGLAASWPPREAQPVRPRELSLLYLDEEWLGTGLAAALTEAILEGGPASVWVAEDNPRARRFYEKAGFAPDGAARVEEHLGSLRDLRMVR